MAAALETVNAILASGQYQPILSVIKGLRNGAVYGVKVRLPHALVMTFLFKQGSLQSKIQAILEATFTHSKNLAAFVFIYKSLTNLMAHLQSEKSQQQLSNLTSTKRSKIQAILEATFTHSKNLAAFVFIYKSLTNLMAHLQSEKSQIHSFIAAFIGGYLIFGKYNKVNEQINLYLLSRVLYGLAKMLVKRGYIPKPKGDVFKWFGAIIWGIVLWQFEYEKDTLQPSLQSSMTYLYHDSNTWNNLKNFIWHNR